MVDARLELEALYGRYQKYQQYATGGPDSERRYFQKTREWPIRSMGVGRLADQGWYFWYGIMVSHPGNTTYLWSIVQESKRKERFGGNEVEARQKNRESRIQHAREKSQADRPRRECVNAANDLLSPTARSPLH